MVENEFHLNKLLTITNIIFLIALWVGAFIYLYEGYQNTFFSGLNRTQVFWELVLIHLKGGFMLLAPAIALTIAILIAPKSITVKFIIALITILAVVVSFHGDSHGYMFMLYMVFAWLVGVGTCITVFGLQDHKRRKSANPSFKRDS